MGVNTEARYAVEDIGSFRRHLLEIGARKEKSYEFDDHIFCPHDLPWDLNKESMKVRVWRSPDPGRVLLVYYLCEFIDGNKTAIAGFKHPCRDAEEAMLLLERWHFTPLFSFSRRGETYFLGDCDFVLEEIENLGFLVEIEGEAHEIDALAKRLCLKDKIQKSIPRLVQEKVMH